MTDLTLPSFTKMDHFGLLQLEENEVKTLWINELGGQTTLPENSKLFSLVIKAKEPVADLQAFLTLDNNIIPNIFVKAGATPVSLSIAVESAMAYRSNELNPSIEKTLTTKLMCEPNPFNGALTLSYLNQGLEDNADINITNALGITVYKREVKLISGANSIEIGDLQRFPSGIYWLNLRHEGKVYSTKIVKN